MSPKKIFPLLFFLIIILNSVPGVTKNKTFKTLDIIALENLDNLLNGKIDAFTKRDYNLIKKTISNSQDSKPWDIYEYGRSLIFSPVYSSKGAGILKSVTENFQDRTYTAALAYLDIARYYGLILLDRTKAQQLLANIEDFPANRVADTASYYRGLFYLLDNDINTAVPYLEKSAKKGSFSDTTPEIYHIYDDSRYLIAWINYYILNNISMAEQSFRALVNDYPGTPYKYRAIYNLGKINFKKGELDNAEALFKRALNLSSSSAEKNMCLEFLKLLKPENQELTINKIDFMMTMDSRAAHKKIQDFNKFCRTLSSDSKRSFRDARNFIVKNSESPFYTIALFMLAEKMRTSGYTNQAKKAYEAIFYKKKGWPCSDEAEYSAAWFDKRGDDIIQQRLEVLREKSPISLLTPMIDLYSSLITLKSMNNSLEIHVKRLKKGSLEFTQLGSFLEGINYLAILEPNLAINALDACVQGYFQSALTDDAQFLMAEIYYKNTLYNKKVSSKTLKKGISGYQKVIIDHAETMYKTRCNQKIKVLKDRLNN